MTGRAVGAGRAVAGPVRAVTLAIVAALFLLPLITMIAGSLRAVGLAPPRSIELVPPGAGLDNYGMLLRSASFLRQALNSFLVAIVAVPVAVVVASWAGFAIARLPRWGSRSLLVLTIVTATIPTTALFVGRIVVYRSLGLTDTPWALVAPALIGLSPLFVLLFAWSYANVPSAFYELASESGLGPLRTWWHVAFPLRRGVAVAAGVGAFILAWGNFLDPLLFIYDERWYTLPLGLRSLAALPPTEQPLMLAGSVLVVLPVLAISLVLLRRHPWRS
jgi:multiple sugar transport system permease protein